MSIFYDFSVPLPEAGIDESCRRGDGSSGSLESAAHNPQRRKQSDHRNASINSAFHALEQPVTIRGLILRVDTQTNLGKALLDFGIAVELGRARGRLAEQFVGPAVGVHKTLFEYQ